MGLFTLKIRGRQDYKPENMIVSIVQHRVPTIPFNHAIGVCTCQRFLKKLYILHGDLFVELGKSSNNVKLVHLFFITTNFVLVLLENKSW